MCCLVKLKHKQIIIQNLRYTHNDREILQIHRKEYRIINGDNIYMFYLHAYVIYYSNLQGCVSFIAKFS